MAAMLGKRLAGGTAVQPAGRSVSTGAREVEVVRVGHDGRATVQDVAAAEEPLEIRLGGRPFVVIMRTPGADRDLAAGFLLSEQIIQSPSDVSAMRYCADADGRDSENILNVWLQGDASVRAQAALASRRHVIATSACGVCGRKSIDDLMEGTHRIDSPLAISGDVIESLPGALRAVQRTFAETGGLHAAALFDAAGTLAGTAEDVGRHNAVDKVIGAALGRGEVPLSNHMLFVSGRTSFEIVQKAVVAGVPIVAAVSAPSSLAIELARDANVTLLGFVRGHTFNIYSVPTRITG
jgi:FdhD protein